ncbi:ABC transporter ATP-binding protein [Gorillibacterium timonense]|uniref:ABC transporter ATP-binding protein n=1 Tax=Gorillibacterium timonense TaxID=1689269 RepID=UPI00071D20F2|nr:ABC transporter ATP-binding protein [Gorillibacterium timonense]
MSLLELKDVTKQYRNNRGLRQVSLQLEPGRIVGLLGPNGSGKTTLMKLIAGLNHPNQGTITVNGIPAGLATKPLVSFMPDKPLTESWMKVRDAIAYYADFFPDFDRQKADELLAFMKLSPADRVESLSKGMNERLQLTIALSRRARLYLLDEPIGGVDPVARGKILDAIVDHYTEDSTLIVSTHLVRDIERIFDEVVFLKEGEIVLHKEVEEIRITTGKSIDELFKEVFAD